MPHSIAQWAVFGGVLAWDLAVGAWCVWRAYRNPPSWRKPLRPPKLDRHGPLTRDWRPML